MHQHGKRHYLQGERKETLLKPAEDKRFDEAAKLFQVLSDDTRLRIFWLLCHEEECVMHLAEWLDISSPAVSHHLKAMKETGILESRRAGKEVFYRAADTETCRTLHGAVEKMLAIACPEEDPVSYDGLMQKIHHYMVENLHQRLTIEALSRQFLINPTTLKEKFRAYYGTSVAAHVKEHRMEKAALLMENGDESMAQIAKKVGYASQSRFAEAFREKWGLLPTEYRKKRKKTEDA